MSTMIDASSMDDKAQRMYLLKIQIQEATAKLARPDLGKKSMEFATFL